MADVTNPALERLRAGQLAVGLNARHSRTSEFAAIAKDCGFHFVFLDDEHSPLPSDKAYEIALAAIRVGVTPLVRARRNEPPDIACHLSNGALGMFIPHVEDKASAERAARSCRFPPVGDLSVPGYLPQMGYTGMPAHEATRRLNDLFMVVAMIESRTAVANIEEIAAVDGLDVLFIGLHDLTHEMGLAGKYTDLTVIAALEAICAAAKRNGKAVGIGGVKENAMWERCVAMGMRMLLVENDLHMLVARMTERARYFNGIPTA
ncbi:MAG: HpcH/HpaI aldolase/citrate lyase family protein [Alphaproteobacteria bacterium]